MAEPRRRRNTYRGLSPEQRDAERRKRILASGLGVFAEQGFEGGTVRALCAAAGVTTRQFYELFSDRDSAFAAVYEYAVGLMLRRTAAAATAAPAEFEPQLRAALETNFLDQGRELRNAQIVVFQLGSTNLRAWARRAEAADAVRDFITAAIEPAVAEPPNPVLMSALAGALYELLWQQNTQSSPYPAAECVEELIRLFRLILDSPGAIAQDRS